MSDPSHSSHRTLIHLVAGVFTLWTAACTGGDQTDVAAGADSVWSDTSVEHFRRQKALIDSVVAHVKPIDVVAKELGAMYSVADDSLAALVRREAEKTRDCYTKARAEHDPLLVGVAHILVNFGAAGWDIIRVERHEFSSFAGGAVVSCINARAMAEWKLPTRGVTPGAHLVQLTFQPDSTRRR